MSNSTITNAKNGTTRSVYTVEGVRALEIDNDSLTELSEQDKIIIQGLSQTELVFETGERLEQLIQRFCYLADYKKTKTHSTGRAKKTDSVEAAKRKAFKSSLPDNKFEYVVNESYDGWSVVKGEVGTVYFDGRFQTPDGKKPVQYYYLFEDACEAAEKIDCSSITLNESGYSLRLGQIPIKVGIKKGSTETKVSHPERHIMSWAMDSTYQLRHSRTEPVKDKRIAKSREIENDKSIMAGQLAELKALKSGKSVVVEEKPKKIKKSFNIKKPEPEPEPEPEEEEEEEEEDSEDEMDVEPVVIDGEDYYYDEKSNKLYDPETSKEVGYYSKDQKSMTDHNELE